jgi:hypothetical protein
VPVAPATAATHVAPAAPPTSTVTEPGSSNKDIFGLIPSPIAHAAGRKMGTFLTSYDVILSNDGVQPVLAS